MNMSRKSNPSSGITSFRETVCRTCLLTSPKALHPLQDQDKQALLNLCNVQVRSVGVLPCRLCGVCRLRLQRMQQFVSQARGAQDALMDYLLNNQADNDNDPIQPINIDTLKDLRGRCFTVEGLGFSKLVTVDCKEDDETKSENSATFTNCINWLSLEDNASRKKPSKADIKHEVELSDEESGGGGEYGEGLVERIKVEPDIMLKVTTKTRAGKKVFPQKPKETRKKVIMKVVKTSKAAGRTKADISGEVSCGVVQDDDATMDKGSSSRENKALDDPPQRSKSTHRDPFQHFHRSLVTIIKLTLDEQLQELEEARKSDKYTLSPYKCVMCAKHFAYELTYKTHMKKHALEAGKISCSLCGMRTKSMSALSKHTALHELRYECKLCGKRFKSRLAISTHTQKHNKGIPPDNYLCRRCGEISPSYAAHRIHQRSHEDKSRFKCPHCPKAFAGAHRLADHVNRHEGIKKHPCPECGKMFVSRVDILSHLVTHSNRREFYCVECNVTFKTRGKLSLHLKTTKKHLLPENLKFRCEECPKAYDTASKLSQHVDVVHRGVRPYTCSVCALTFRTYSAVRHHRARKHDNKTQPKDHICQFCNKGFSSTTILRHHVLIHTGEKPFSCSYCGTAFRQKAAMTTHIRLVHLKVNRNGTKRT